MAAHITQLTRHIELSPKVRLAYSRGNDVVKRLPPEQRDLLGKTVTGKIRGCIGADFDKTLVPTDENRRQFYFLGEDSLGILGPLGSNTFMGIPTGVISGNTIEYVNARCAEPIQAFMLGFTRKQTAIEGIQSSAIYALNGGHITVYDQSGAENWAAMEKYNIQQRIPKPLAHDLAGAMQEAVRPFLNAPLQEPIPIRSGHTTSYVFSPVLQNRAGVQICLIGVPPEERAAIIDAIKSNICPENVRKFCIQPGGEYSIDGALSTLEKRSAGLDFLHRANASHMFYFGDAVYKRGDLEGNDYSMVHNPDTTVFAVNADSREVPEHESVFWIGSGPEATYNMLTWMAIERANHLINDGEEKRTMAWSLLKYAGMTQEQVTS
jgi:hypothetical protein